MMMTMVIQGDDGIMEDINDMIMRDFTNFYLQLCVILTLRLSAAMLGIRTERKNQYDPWMNG